MKHLLAAFVLLTAVLFCQPMPDARVKTLEGKSISLKSALGKGPTLILFWATWCAPCKRELDSYMEYYEEFEGNGVTVLAIATDDPRTVSKVKPTAESRGYEFTILTDANQELSRLFNFSSIPYSMLVNKKGEIVYTHSGYKPGDESAMLEKIDALLGK